VRAAAYSAVLHFPHSEMMLTAVVDEMSTKMVCDCC
jgi:hypothetical protein